MIRQRWGQLQKIVALRQAQKEAAVLLVRSATEQTAAAERASEVANREAENFLAEWLKLMDCGRLDIAQSALLAARCQAADADVVATDATLQRATHDERQAREAALRSVLLLEQAQRLERSARRRTRLKHAEHQMSSVEDLIAWRRVKV
jgi:hypothetical protein